jgi:hypothetical protein
MSPETINLIIGIVLGVVLTLLTLSVGSYVQNGKDERQRKWELEDRESDRRSLIQDMRMKEAREMVDIYDVYLSELEGFVFQFGRLKKNNDREEMVKSLAEFAELKTMAPSFLREAAKKTTSLSILKDARLFSLGLDLAKLARTASLDAQAFIKDSTRDPVNGNTPGRDIRLKKLSENSRRARLAVDQVKDRLNELSKST